MSGNIAKLTTWTAAFSQFNKELRSLQNTEKAKVVSKQLVQFRDYTVKNLSQMMDETMAELESTSWELDEKTTGIDPWLKDLDNHFRADCND